MVAVAAAVALVGVVAVAVAAVVVVVVVVAGNGASDAVGASGACGFSGALLRASRGVATRGTARAAGRGAPPAGAKASRRSSTMVRLAYSSATRLNSARPCTTML